jgi:hypothetical protein
MMNGHSHGPALEQAERRIMAASPAALEHVLQNLAGQLAAIGVQGSDIVRRLKGAANQRGVSGGRVYDTINAGIREARQSPQSFTSENDESSADVASEPAPDPEGELSPEIQAARAAFRGEGGISSWRRVVRGAAPGKELTVLEIATQETLQLARKAKINEIEVIDFFYELADAQGITTEYGPDAVQAAFARARSAQTIEPARAQNQGTTIASTASDESPIPLIPELAPAAPYPVGALGPALGEAAVSIARKVQCPIEIAAQSVLAVASLAAQAHADVLMPFGQTRPLSLFLFSIALSSDRKTSADYEALTPIREREKELVARFSQIEG